METCCFAAQIRRGKRFNQRFPKDNGQQSVTVEIFDSSATPQKGSGNLNANGGENEKSNTQMTESKNETILSK